jgi:hypothetical protein
VHHPLVATASKILLQEKTCSQDSRAEVIKQSRAESFFFACLLRNIANKKGQGNCASKWSSWELHD